MKKIILMLYTVWVFALVGIASYGWLVKEIGEYGVSSQLLLIATGLPSSLISLSAQNGSIQGVVLAGSIGLVQWYLVLKYFIKGT